MQALCLSGVRDRACRVVELVSVEERPRFFPECAHIVQREDADKGRQGYALVTVLR
ncbi:hypothetical protein CTATCC11996_15980 [Comamonas testosteroni ATCC 11996]|nr:hypothetical protein CTATCC11996_15980 [Comamonas testosteroni ATCC 11996]